MKTIGQALEKRGNDYSQLEREYLKTTGASLALDPLAAPKQVAGSKLPSITIVLPAWNMSNSILPCLVSIDQSSFNLRYPDLLQVVVVDDGSTDDTWDVVKNAKLSMNLTIVRQKHGGQAVGLNTGISIAEGEIVISCDADMVLSYYTIEQLAVRHQQLTNVLLIGFFSNTTSEDERVAPDFIRKYGAPIDNFFTGDWRLTFPTPGYPDNMMLASKHLKRLGQNRGLWMPDDETEDNRWILPDFVDGVIFSLPREMYYKIGGYDERLQGWGCTDSLMGAKAIAQDNFVVPIYSVSGLHIGHPFRTTNKLNEYTQNRKKFFDIIKTEDVNDHPNWLTKAKDRVIESFVKKSSGNTKRINKEGVKSSTTSGVNQLLALGKFAEAYKLIKKLGDENDVLNLGKALIGMRKYQEAVECLKDQTSESVDSITMLVTAYAANGEFALAHKAISKLSTVKSQLNLTYWHQPASLRVIQGTNYFSQGFYDIALRCFENALTKEPRNNIALEYREKCQNYIVQ